MYCEERQHSGLQGTSSCLKALQDERSIEHIDVDDIVDLLDESLDFSLLASVIPDSDGELELIASELSAYQTDQTDTLAITFALTYRFVDHAVRKQYGALETWITPSGDCYYSLNTKRVSAARIIGARLEFIGADGVKRFASGTTFVGGDPRPQERVIYRTLRAPMNRSEPEA